MLGPESERPPWLEAFERFGLFMSRTVITELLLQRRPSQGRHGCRFGVHELTKGKAPKQLDFANDRLYQAYFDKNPQVCLSQSAKFC